jgi:integrase
MTELLWLTCSRPLEILTLRRGDVQTGGKLMLASGLELDLDEFGVWAAVKDKHKTDDGGYDRVIFFGPQCQAVLAPFLDRVPTAFLFDPAEGRGRKPGEKYGEKVLNKAIKRVCQRMGVVPFSPYQIRHATFKRVQKEFGRDAARVYGGHKVGGATEMYAGADLAMAAKVAAKMG